MASLSDGVLEHAAGRPDAIAVRGPDSVYTYGQLKDGILAYAGMLRERGIERGDRVLFICPSVPEFAVAYLGVNAVGAIALPANPLCTETELGYYIEDGGCRMVIAWDGISQAGRAAAAAAGIDFVALTTGANVSEGTPLESPVDLDRDDVACLLYTSGTTGRPKGAELTVNNLNEAARISNQLGDESPEDRAGTSLPLFHVFGQASVLLACLRAGAALSLRPTFHPKDFIDMIVDDELTIVAGVPTMWNAMLHVPDDVKEGAFDNLRLAVSGGASLPREITQAFQRRFGCMILEGYGLTETCGAATFSRPGVTAPEGTVGMAVYDCDVEVRDHDGAAVPTGERGEVYIRGPVVMRGYWNRPDATAETIVDGWLKTGDIGEMDADDFWNTVLDPQRRTVIRVHLDDGDPKLHHTLFGGPPEGRRTWMADVASRVDTLALDLD